MNPKPPPSAMEWVRRVNRTWLVRGRLNQDAEAWLDHLAALDDGRLEASCEAARRMCGLRDPGCDPKPWFYAGLFSLATPDEAKKFLADHRITRAVVPGMEDDEDVKLWMDRVGPETRELIGGLRTGLRAVRGYPNS